MESRGGEVLRKGGTGRWHREAAASPLSHPKETSNPACHGEPGCCAGTVLPQSPWEHGNITPKKFDKRDTFGGGVHARGLLRWVKHGAGDWGSTARRAAAVPRLAAPRRASLTEKKGKHKNRALNSGWSQTR